MLTASLNKTFPSFLYKVHSSTRRPSRRHADSRLTRTPDTDTGHRTPDTDTGHRTPDTEVAAAHGDGQPGTRAVRAAASLFWGAKGEPDLHWGGGGGARERHRNEGCTIKSQLGGGGARGVHGVNGG